MRGGEAVNVGNIREELLKVGVVMISGLNIVLTDVWKPGTIPPD